MSDSDKPFKKLERKQEIKKSPKPRKTGRWYLIPIGLVLAVTLSVGLYFLYKTYKVSADIGLQLTPGSIFNPQEKEPELKKDSSGKYTNVMLIGIDTRENSSLLNTDTIIMASYNYETKNVSMISIPRDFHVQVNPDVVWFNKINSVYGTNEQKKSGSGLEGLKKVVEDVTGQEIQYYAMIDLKGFVELIDAVGGVDVNVQNSFIDRCYPTTKGSTGAYLATCGESGKDWYKTLNFKTGVQHMDGKTALEYSRSRHGNNGEGSDFMRARRQQNVIMAFKDTILSSDTLLNPKKITDLMSAVQNNFKASAFTLTDVEAGIRILKEFDTNNGSTYSFVLDPSAGNSSLIKVGPNPTVEYFINPIAGNGRYDDIHEYVDLILKNPQIYEENPSIYVYNTGIGYQEASKKTQELKEEFKYLNVKFLGTLFSNQEGNYIYSHKENEYMTAVNSIAKYIGTENLTKPEFISNDLHNENITILLGKEVTNKDTQLTSEASN